MHNETDILSSVIKSARENAGITIEALDWASHKILFKRKIPTDENPNRKGKFMRKLFPKRVWNIERG